MSEIIPIKFVQIPPLPPARPYPSVTPFTDRDGDTYTRVLETLIVRMNVIINEVNQLAIDLTDNMRDEMQKLRDDVQAALDEFAAGNAATINSLIVYVDEAVQSILNASIEVNDSIVAKLISDDAAGPLTNAALDTYLAVIRDDLGSLRDSTESGFAMVDTEFASLGDRVGVVETDQAALSSDVGKIKSRQPYYVADYGVDTSGGDAAPALRAMLNAVPPNAIVIIRDTETVRLNTLVTLSKPVTLTGGGTIIAAPSESTLVIDSSDVEISNLTIVGVGPGGEGVTDYRIITSTGRASAPHSNVRISGLRMNGSKGTFIWVDWLTDFTIENCVITNGQYAGIMLISCVRGRVIGNTVTEMKMSAPFINCYGIAATDVDNTIESRSQDILIDGNFVSGMRGWEGIDTHGGRNIKIVNNTVKNCTTGIAVTVGNVSRTTPPQNCYVAGNYIERGDATGNTAGIVFNGKSGGGLPDRLATGSIGVNTIMGYSKDVICDLVNPDNMTIQHQTHNGGTKNSPSHPVFMEYGAIVNVVVPMNDPGAVRTLQLPTGFTAPPIVQATRATSSAARFNVYVNNASATSVDIGLYDGSGVNHGELTIPVHVTATQYRSGGNGVPAP